jgi:SAM-dependent methyltransferase
MTTPPMDSHFWESLYQQDTPPAYSIGRPQPEFAALIDGGKVRSDVLDAGCGHAALSLELAKNGYTVHGLDDSATAIAAATAAAERQALQTATFEQAEITSFGGHDERFNTIMDSGLFHVLPPDRRQDYLQCIHRAAAPQASLFILAFAVGLVANDREPGPIGLTEDELRAAVSVLWTVNELRPATIYAKPPDPSTAEPDLTGGREPDDTGLIGFPAFLLSAHKR